MPFSVMAGLVPAIYVVWLARSPNAQPVGRQQDAKQPCGWTTWMAGTSPVMTDGAVRNNRFIFTFQADTCHPRESGDPAWGHDEAAT